MGVETPEVNPDQGWQFSPFTRRAASVIAMVTFIAIAVILVWQMITLLLVLFLGVLFAIFLRGLTNHVVKRTPLGENLALFAVTASLVAFFGVTGWFMAPSVAEQATEGAEIIPQAIAQLQHWFAETPMGQRILTELEDVDLSSVFDGAILGPVGGAVFGTVGAISHFFFIIFVGIYFAFDPNAYKRGMVSMVPLHYRERAEEIIDVCTHQLAWWLIGRLMAMLGVAIMVSVGLWILGVPLPLFLGLIAGLFSFVPILGPIVSVVPAALVALLMGPQYVLWVGFLYMGAQAVESYFITPMVQHRVVSMPHAMTLIAEIFAGILFGVIGITVATPLAVLLMALINMIYVEDVLGDTTPFRELADKYH